ncbi:MAG: C40 family peptidase [Candidatus Abawacabacteria bacterium]|nr:C40 family peptidase [Candidatus Abawacabacteria bacterium]
MNQVKNIVNGFVKELQRKYGVATCELNITEEGSRIVIGGVMLTDKQKAILDRRLQQAGERVEWRIVILADQEPALGWAHVDKIPTNVWSRTLLQDHISWLSTQVIIKEEPIKLLWQAKDFYCVQLVDATIGWIRAIELTRLAGAPSWIPPEQKASNRPELLAYIDRWLDVPYLRGGLTYQGVDCSGLTQNIYRHCFHYLLPRHSMDQLKVGHTVTEPKIGDLVFFEHHHEKTHHTTGHVGIVINAEAKLVAHANLTNGKVMQNMMSEMLAMGYEFLGYRNYDVEIF